MSAGAEHITTAHRRYDVSITNHDAVGAANNAFQQALDRAVADGYEPDLRVATTTLVHVWCTPKAVA